MPAGVDLLGRMLTAVDEDIDAVERTSNLTLAVFLARATSGRDTAELAEVLARNRARSLRLRVRRAELLAGSPLVPGRNGSRDPTRPA